MELSVGKRIRCIDTQKEGIVVDFLTKEETKECKMFGQLVRIQLNDGTIEERCYDYELLEENSWKEELLNYLQLLAKRKDLGAIKGKDAAPKSFVDNAILGMCPKEVSTMLLSKISSCCDKNMYGYQYDILAVINIIRDSCI